MLKTLVADVTVILSETPEVTTATLMTWTSKGVLLPRLVIELISNPLRKVKAFIGVNPWVLKGRITLTWFTYEQPAKLAVSILKELASMLVRSSAMKLNSISVHSVYFHWVLIKKSTALNLSLLAYLTEKKRSLVDWASKPLTAIATPGLFWKGLASV